MPDRSVLISTWQHGRHANAAAWKAMAATGDLIAAVEAAARAVEADPAVTSVGYGGYPDCEGEVTLDACIMDGRGNSGAVACLRGIRHAVTVARLVMQHTPHRFIAGEGARRLALLHGLREAPMLTPAAAAAWAEFRRGEHADSAGHDTVATLGLREGRLAGSCTTSGLAWKLPGRVGDSPIVGAGLYVDDEVGAAAGTGKGEHILATLGSYAIVENMARGTDPTHACRNAVKRVLKRCTVGPDDQVAFIAIARDGRTGAFSLRPGFTCAIRTADRDETLPADSWLH